ncbi:kinase-like domain-containing protein [Cercophora scortea]|uniref:Kinase-like domain-containing protein n=1 Tax=Cercophora scortea TaxID=314031 RepID=A0AAE0MJR0_9PEZI|nr:kinase-like domain-containing protein [Cercophora scortea]
MPPPRHPVSDLVSDAKIETTILSDSIQHVFYAPGHSAQRRQEQRVENWSRERKLGEGAFGVVYLERCQPEVEGGACKLRAVKQIKKHIVPEQELDYMRELEAIFKFSNPRYSHCFVRSDGWFEEGDYVFISMEYLEHGDLQTHLVRRPLPEIETRQITSQVLEGLEYMHENGFVHRDLKPSNIMVVSKSPEWFVKIADFGISKRRQQGATTTDTMNKGTLGFTAPEVFGFGSGEGDGGVSYSFAVDLWSLGAVVYLMLTNTLVFPTLGDLFKYATGATVFPADRLKAFQISEQVLDLVTQLMIPTAVDRPTAKSAMGHSWMTAPLIQLKGTNSDG